MMTQVVLSLVFMALCVMIYALFRLIRLVDRVEDRSYRNELRLNRIDTKIKFDSFITVSQRS